MERRKMCWRRLLCLTLAALVLASCLTMTAFAADPQDSEENGIVDFVLVLDCSGSLNVTDPSHLCATACKMFVDMVPLENARISVIAFGYDGGTQYTLKNMSIDNPLDLKKVYLVSDMVEASAIKDKNALKQQVTDATSKSGTNTPLGTALLSAVDLLENNGASDKNACVILLTDGRIAAQQNRYDDKDNAHTAAKTAASHDWPVYTMHLNDGERYGAGSEETTLMRQIAEESGAGEDGYTPLTSFQEGNAAVARAFMNIFNRFMFGGNGNIITKTADAQGDVTCDFEVPELTSETTVIVSGASLKSVTVNGPDGSSRLFIGAGNVFLQDPRFHPPLAPPADLDGRQLSGPDQRIGLGRGDVEYLSNVGQCQEPLVRHAVFLSGRCVLHTAQSATAGR